MFIIVLTAVSILVKMSEDYENSLSEQLSHDKLTGLPNRYYISAYLDFMMGKDKINDS